LIATFTAIGNLRVQNEKSKNAEKTEEKSMTS